MVQVMGVDFSGGREIQGSGTWITEGQFENGKLAIQCSRPTSRSELEQLLNGLPDNSVATLDFPFSVPKDFGEHWKQGATEMPDLWRAAACTDWDGFLTMCKDWIDAQSRGSKHPLRIGDLRSTKPLSSLNTLLMPMTFYGMQMLHRLWKSDRRFRVPPLRVRAGADDRPELVEIMPGAALAAIGLPSDGYKNVSKTIKESDIANNRRQILGELEDRTDIEIVNLDLFRGTFLSHHDGLDSLVAAVLACRWKVNERQFHHPSGAPTDCSQLPSPARCQRAFEGALAMPQRDAARLEGWMYVPNFNGQ